MLPLGGVLANDTALPQGENVVAGQASFDRSTPSRLDVHQSTGRAVIEWQSFNIGKNATTQFHQPSTSSLTVNRVVGGNADPSEILGTLKANGRVMVLDRNGVLFGKDSIVDVGGIVASTGDVNTQAVMAGDQRLDLTNMGEDGAVINEGHITVSEGGLAAFVAPHVANHGRIYARMGKVALAGEQAKATVDLYGDGLVEIAIDDQKAKALSAQNTGTIEAHGGIITISTGDAENLINAAVNVGGVVNASSVTQSGGKIILGGAQSGIIRVAKNADINASSTNQKGGDITVTAKNTHVESGAKLDASGAKGGGKVRIGGDKQGQGDLARATHTRIESGAEIYADATVQGDGGEVIIWSDDKTFYGGQAFARGVGENGKGGFVETSGKKILDFAESGYGVDVSGNDVFSGGDWLLDPTNIIIDAAMANTLTSTMNGGGNVTVSTAGPGSDEGTLTVASDIRWHGPGSLTLLADGSVLISREINAAWSFGAPTQGAVKIRSYKDIDINANITTQSGDIDIDSGLGTYVNAALTTHGGDIDMTDTRITTNFSDSQSLRVAGGGSLVSNNGDIKLDAIRGRVVVEGRVDSGTGRTDIDGHSVRLYNTANVTAETLDFDAQYNVLQDTTSTLDVTTLTGRSTRETKLLGTNTVDNLGDFSTRSTGFELNIGNGGLNVLGRVEAVQYGGDVDINVKSAGANVLRVMPTGQLVSSGGEVSLTNQNGAIVVDGLLEARSGTSSGTVSLSGTSIDLLSNANIISDFGDDNGVLDLTATQGNITQSAGSRLTSGTLQGSSVGKTDLISTNNDVYEIAGFETGNGFGSLGGFTFIGNGAGSTLSIDGNLKANGGNIDITNNTGHVYFRRGYTTDVRGNGRAGDVTLQARNVLRFQGDHRVYADNLSLTSTNNTIDQQAASSLIVGGELAASAYHRVDLQSLSNQIDDIGNVTAGAGRTSATSSFIAITNAADSWDIIGDLNTSGGTITINGVGSSAGAVTLGAANNILSKGGNITLDVAGGLDLAGTVETAPDANNPVGTLLVNAGSLELSGNSSILAHNVTLNATNSNVLQTKDSTIRAALLSGSSKTDTQILGTNNQFALGNFTTGEAAGHQGGFTLRHNGSNLDVSGDVRTYGGLIDVDVQGGNLSLLTGASMNSDGGNLSLTPSGTLNIADANALITSGTGSITMTVDSGSDLDKIVNTIQHNGTGVNTIILGNGIFQNLGQWVFDYNLNLRGQGQGNTRITKGFNTAQSGAGASWMRVESGKTVAFENFTLDGLGRETAEGIVFEGAGSINNVAFKDIVYNDPFSTIGTAVIAKGDGRVNITNSSFTGTGQTGVQFVGAGVSGSVFADNTYTGKGVGGLVDYGVRIDGGAQNVEILRNTITNNLGTNAGRASAAILMGGNGANTASAIIRNNVITDNSVGVVASQSATDDTAITASDNKFEKNTSNVRNESAIGAKNFSGNWWGTSDAAQVAASMSGAQTGALDVSPFLMSGDDADLATAGFQGAKNSIGVTASLNQTGSSGRIQEAIDMVSAGGTVRVGNGDYAENVSINKALNLYSQNGRTMTSITGQNGTPSLGAIVLENNVNDVNIGRAGEGFRIVGIDNGNPAVENAAVYLRGNHDNIDVIDNEIVANGDHGFLSEYGATINDLTLSQNIFSGQTFEGKGPAGVGFSRQFIDNNIPRQLVTIGGGVGGGNTSNVTFTNNVISGRAGGISSDDGVTEQGNTLVTIDTNGGVITGNRFDGATTDTASALRARGVNTQITNNEFRDTMMGASTVHLLVAESTYTGLGGGMPTDLASLYAANTFTGRAVYSTSESLANFDVISASIQTAVNNTNAGATVHAKAATYQENIVLNRGVTVEGEGNGSGVADTILEGNAIGGDALSVTSDDVTITNLRIQNFSRSIVVDGNVDTTTVTNIVSDNSQTGLYIDDASNITNLRVEDSHFGGGDFGLASHNGSENTDTIITNNTFDNSDTDVSFLGATHHASMERNTFQGVNGVRITDDRGSRIEDNDFENGETGLDLDIADGTDVRDNRFTNNRNGVRIVDGTGVDLGSNTVSAAIDDGVIISGASANISLFDNTIEDSGQVGLRVSSSGNGLVELIDNRFTNNQTGALMSGGRVDFSNALLPNTFSGGQTGMLFVGGVELVGDTLGATEFNNQTQYYVRLGKGAFSAPATEVDATFASFDGFIPDNNPGGAGALPQAKLTELEDKIFDVADEAGLGDIVVGQIEPANAGGNVDDEDVFETAALNFKFPSRSGSVNFQGGVNTGASGQQPGGANNFDPAALNNLTPAAGGDDAEALNALTPAAGDEQGQGGSACDAANGGNGAGGDLSDYTLPADPFAAIADEAC